MEDEPMSNDPTTIESAKSDEPHPNEVDSGEVDPVPVRASRTNRVDGDAADGRAAEPSADVERSDSAAGSPVAGTPVAESSVAEPPVTVSSAAGESATGSRTTLDTRWIRLQRTVRLIGVTVFSIVTGLIVALTFSSLTMPWTIWVPAGWVGCLVAGIFFAVVLPRLSYEHWSYQIDDRVIQVRHGILWQSTLAIPISRLQHVDLHRGPIERRFGLSSLEIHTAGTRAASHLIPGLSHDTANAMRDRLIDAANRGADVNRAD